MGATSRDLGIAAVYNQAVTNLATQRSLGNISQTQFEREMATLEPLRARAGFDTRNARNESSRPQTPTSSAEQTKPQVTDNKLNTENANIQNRGVDLLFR
jgi:hypothetical protein